MKKLLFSASVLAGFAFTSSQANALVVINVIESGGSLIFNTSGSLNLSGASFLGGIGEADGFISGGSNWYIASGSAGSVDNYAMTTFAGPFGTNFNFISNPTTSIGDQFFIWGNGGDTEQVGVPVGYLSGTLFNSSMTFAGLTIGGIGLLSGTYNYAIPNDNIVLNIGKVSAVPLPAALPLFLGSLAGVGFVARRRKQKSA